VKLTPHQFGLTVGVVAAAVAVFGGFPVAIWMDSQIGWLGSYTVGLVTMWGLWKLKPAVGRLAETSDLVAVSDAKTEGEYGPD